MKEKKETDFPEFYNICTNTQARLIDFESDSIFLIKLLRCIVEEELKNGDIFPFIKDLANNVIIYKIISHEEAPAKMEKALKTVEYFREFDKVLKKVLSDWSVINE